MSLENLDLLRSLLLLITGNLLLLVDARNQLLLVFIEGLASLVNNDPVIEYPRTIIKMCLRTRRVPRRLTSWVLRNSHLLVMDSWRLETDLTISGVPRPSLFDGGCTASGDGSRSLLAWELTWTWDGIEQSNRQECAIRRVQNTSTFLMTSSRPLEEVSAPCRVVGLRP